MKAYTCSIITILLVLGSVPAIGASQRMQCTHQRNVMIYGALNKGAKLSDIAKYLRSNSVSFSAYSIDEQKINIESLDENEISRRGVSSLLIMSKWEKKKWSLVEKAEILTMEFDKGGKLESYNCKIYYTGP